VSSGAGAQRGGRGAGGQGSGGPGSGGGAGKRPPPAGVSLPRALSKLGLCSRSQGEALVAGGRVRVDGRVVTDPTVRVDMNRVRITVDDSVIAAERRVYLMLNKPAGTVTTRDDPEGRDTVYRCLAGVELPFVSPVGRLDLESEGLLLFTNDTRWGQRLLDPDSHVDKVYHVLVDDPAGEELLQRISAGVQDRGEHLGVRAVRRLGDAEPGALLEIVLDEGRNRHIRRLLTALGVTIRRLRRVAIGPLELGQLATGQHRALTAEEVAALTVPRPRTAG
jgi:23S rRNA pseudouridine2605 synthase